MMPIEEEVSELCRSGTACSTEHSMSDCHHSTKMNVKLTSFRSRRVVEERYRSPQSSPVFVLNSSSKTTYPTAIWEGSREHMENHEADVVDGVLNLSGCSLTALSSKFRREYSKVRNLWLSNNEFTSMTGMALFTHCQQIDVSHNMLYRLTSLHPLGQSLTVLEASHNNLTKIDPSTFAALKKLVRLNLSHNAIHDMGRVELLNLEQLELDGNHLTELPDLSSCHRLQSLCLAENKIQSLQDAEERLPGTLSHLELCYNEIEDLSQLRSLVFLCRVTKFAIEGNRCIPLGTARKPAPFNWIAYVCCLLERLETLDGRSIAKRDKLRGEWLATQSKGRKFLPGSHTQLVNFLLTYMPAKGNPAVENTLDKIMPTWLKSDVLSSDVDDLSFSSHSQAASVYSPHAMWSMKVGLTPNSKVKSCDVGKENDVPSSRLASPNAHGTPVRRPLNGSSRSSLSHSFSSTSSRNFSAQSVVKSPYAAGMRMVSPRSLSHNGDTKSSTSTLLQTARSQHDDEKRNSSSSSTSSYSVSPTVYVPNQGDCVEEGITTLSAPKPAPRTVFVEKENIEQIDIHGHSKCSQNEEKDAPPVVKVLNSTITLVPRAASPVPRIADITVLHEDKTKEERFFMMDDRVSYLEGELDRLSKVNEELVGLVSYMHKEIQKCSQAFEQVSSDRQQTVNDMEKLRFDMMKMSMLPTPRELRVSDCKHDRFEVEWSSDPIAKFRVLVDGQDIGTVDGTQKRVRICDLQPGSSHAVQVQAIGAEGIESDLSQTLKIQL